MILSVNTRAKIKADESILGEVCFLILLIRRIIVKEIFDRVKDVE